MKKYLIGLSLGMFTVIANAQFISAGKLVENHHEHDYGKAFAIGYILGVIDSYDGTAFCIPENTKSGELRDLVIEALEDNPQVSKQVAADTIFRGFSAAFPCQGRKTNKSIL